MNPQTPLPHNPIPSHPTLPHILLYHCFRFDHSNSILLRQPDQLSPTSTLHLDTAFTSAGPRRCTNSILGTGSLFDDLPPSSPEHSNPTCQEPSTSAAQATHAFSSAITRQKLTPPSHHQGSPAITRSCTSTPFPRVLSKNSTNLHLSTISY